MNTKSFIILIALALGVAVIIMSYGKSSTYRCFGEATESNEYHIVGVLDKNAALNYNPAKNANLFTFRMTDSCGSTMPVEYRQPKPQDFERSDKIVCIGMMKNDTFRASQILLKCPSKYNDAKL